MFLSLITFYPAEPRHIELNDGYEATYYTFTKGNRDSVATFLFLIAGSSHASMAFSRYYLKDLPGHVHVFALQKRYISHHCSHVSQPPDEYYHTHYLSSFLRDQIEFINTILSREATIPERVVVLGVSAGGTVACAVPAEVPEITHLVVLGEGGMKGMDYFRAWGAAHGYDFDEIYEMVSQEPTTEKFWGGYTYRYWLELLEADPMGNLLELDIPLLFGIGENDEMTLIGSVRYLETQFAKHGKHNLDTIVYPGCNHALEDSAGNSHRKEFLQDMHDWLHAGRSWRTTGSDRN
jgi:pimeloyl-ACP methyl ester carboxylesterase